MIKKVKLGIYFSLIAAATGSLGYFLTPNRTKSIQSGNNTTIDARTNTFLENLKNIQGLDADLNASLSWGENTLTANAKVYFKMNGGFDDLDFVINANATYNSKSISADLAYVDDTLYASIFDVRVKSTVTNSDELVNRLAELGIEPEIDFGNLDTSSIDLSSITDALSGMVSSKTNNGYKYEINSDMFNLVMTSDKDYDLTGVILSNLAINDLTINLSLTCDTKADITTKLVSPETAEVKYVEVINYWNVFEKLYPVIKNKQFGLNLKGNLVSSTKEILNINTDINLDLATKRFGVDLGIFEGETQASTLNIDYINDGVYVEFNDSLKAKVSPEALNSIINKLKTNVNSVDQDKLSSLFSFVTESPLMVAISEGRYEEVLNIVDSISNDDNTLTAKIRLKDLGLGENSLVNLTIDATKDSVVGLDVSGITLADYTLNASASVEDYVVNEVDDTKYEDFSFASNVFDEIYDVVQAKKSGFELEGSVLDANSLGMTFTGNGQFDVTTKGGRGELTIKQITNKYTQRHNVKIDVNELDSMLFSYNDKLNGKFTIQTLNDIIGLVKELMNEKDERFTKFFEPIKEMFAASTIGKIIKEQNFVEFVKPGVIKHINKTTDGLDILIGKDLFDLDSDINIVVGLDSTDNLTAIKLNNFIMNGKTINASIKLTAYNDQLIHVLKEDKNNHFYDFSDIKVLLECGLTTSKLGYFHINGKVNATVLSIIDLDLDVDFHITVDGKKVQVIGYISNIPVIYGVNNTHFLASGGKRNAIFIYEDGFIHLRRTTTFKIGTRYNDDLYKKVKVETFTNNIADYLLGFMVGVTDKLMAKINNAGSNNDGSTPVAYENILNNYSYDKTNKSWKIGIDVGSLAQNDDLGVLNIVISANSENYINKLNADITMHPGVKIVIGIDVTLNDIGSDIPSSILAEYNNYISSHANDIAE